MTDKDLVSEVLEKMIDSQISNTRALTALRGTLDENNSRLKDIDKFFRNGFRSDIKELLSAVENAQKDFKDRGEKIEGRIESVEKSLIEVKQNSKWWAKVAALLLALGAIAAVIIKFI